MFEAVPPFRRPVTVNAVVLAPAVIVPPCAVVRLDPEVTNGVYIRLGTTWYVRILRSESTGIALISPTDCIVGTAAVKAALVGAKTVIGAVVEVSTDVIPARETAALRNENDRLGYSVGIAWNVAAMSPKAGGSNSRLIG